MSKQLRRVAIIRWLSSLERKHKNLIHLGVLGFIIATLLHEGAQMADWGFAALSLLCEIPGGE